MVHFVVVGISTYMILMKEKNIGEGRTFMYQFGTHSQKNLVLHVWRWKEVTLNVMICNDSIWFKGDSVEVVSWLLSMKFMTFYCTLSRFMTLLWPALNKIIASNWEINKSTGNMDCVRNINKSKYQDILCVFVLRNILNYCRTYHE